MLAESPKKQRQTHIVFSLVIIFKTISRDFDKYKRAVRYLIISYYKCIVTLNV